MIRPGPGGCVRMEERSSCTWSGPPGVPAVAAVLLRAEGTPRRPARVTPASARLLGSWAGAEVLVDGLAADPELAGQLRLGDAVSDPPAQLGDLLGI